MAVGDIHSEIDIVNDALARIGGHTIPSFASPGPPGTNVERIYRAQLRHLLGTYPWHFTKDIAALTRESTAPAIRWKYRFRLPHNRLVPPKAYYDRADAKRPFTRFELVTDAVLSDASALWCMVQRVPDVRHWPAYFVELVSLATMAEFALAIREDQPLRAKLKRELYGAEQYLGQGGLWALATSADAQAAPSESMNETGDPVSGFRQSGAGFHYDDGEW